MTEFDYAVLLIVGVSVAIGAIRGLIREAFSLAGWIMAFVAANTFGNEMAGWLSGWIHNDSARLIAAFVLVFVLVLLAMGLAGMWLSKLFRIAGLGLADRALGAIFGLARGIVVAVAAVMIAGFTTLPRQPEWRNALLSPPLETAVVAAKPWMPRDVAERIRYR
jgi:membrane protein required for colicin V production